MYLAAYSEVFNETFGPVSHHAIGIAFQLQQCQLTKDQLQALGRQHKTAPELYRDSSWRERIRYGIQRGRYRNYRRLFLGRRSRGQDFTGGEGEQDTDVYYALGGPTVKFSRNHRAQPFARVMAGIGYTRFKATNEVVNPIGVGTTGNSFVIAGADFAASVGGGLDVRVNDSLKVRIFQVDWAPVFLKDRTVDVLGSSGIIQPATLNGQRQDNWRFSVGLAF